MKGDFTKFLASLLVAFLFGASPIAFAQPQSWTYHASPSLCFFQGTATIDGADVEVGDIIGAFVDADAGDDSVNDLCIGKSDVTTTGVYGLMNVYGDDPSTAGEKDGADVNETVYFKIWDASLDRISYAVADGNTQWESGGDPKTVNLSATSGISADASGNQKDAFELAENIYGKAILALKATTQYDLYVVYDRSPWSDGDSIPSRLAESESSFTTDASGNMQAGTLLYSSPAPGNYDIVIDVNADGVYNDNVDFLDDSSAVGAQSLPVELSLFTTTASESGVTIRWRTETEINNIGFSIYRSEEKDGKYTKIAFISGAGNSAIPIDYQFNDEKVEQYQTYFYYLEDIDVTGEKKQSEITKAVTGEIRKSEMREKILPPPKPVIEIPKEFRLLPNYPNPFNPGTWFPYELAHESSVIIRIFNQKGKIVRTLYLGRQSAGNYVAKGKAAYWDGRDDLGQSVASGVYIYTLQAGKFKAARKMLIVK
jgi:hypothetical protein